MPDFDFSTLVTDRIEADAARVEELAARIVAGTATSAERTAFDTALKGAYGSNDMNRVGRAVTALADALNGLGYGVSVSPKTDWAEDDIPTPEEFAAYLADAAAVRDALGATLTLPGSIDALTVECANAIERTLATVHELLGGMADAWQYCGAAISGDY